ncbi:ATP synthase F1 subunit epsilon [Echinicola strongylocentroti]|uniref:ATP synthase F1 subunit epsilon n=1 Tax=Echinicola strongylocentroti TaxID=1795355 RepID=A0A2Z4IJH2_9BACT|nr:ATP synthase F1 subunit epsilon [Echinicola strongylocentroti]AWW31292.1 ATP synthase F1 subunit epsilon [Echinicola strongylocentroti]
MHLEIITPDKKVFQGEVSEATFPGASGAFQILKNHAPVVSALAKGTVSYTTNDGKKSIEVDGGVVEVRDNEIILLAEKVTD